MIQRREYGYYFTTATSETRQKDCINRRSGIRMAKGAILGTEVDYIPVLNYTETGEGLGTRQGLWSQLLNRHAKELECGEIYAPPFPALFGESNAVLVVEKVTKCTGSGETFLSRPKG